MKISFDWCELEAAYALLNRSKERFLESAQAWHFPFFFRDMPDIACHEEIIVKFLGTQPSPEFLRTALELCVHPTMMPVFEAWLATMPSAEEVGRLKKYCKNFLAAYPEAAKKVNSLYK